MKCKLLDGEFTFSDTAVARSAVLQGCISSAQYTEEPMTPLPLNVQQVRLWDSETEHGLQHLDQESLLNLLKVCVTTTKLCCHRYKRSCIQRECTTLISGATCPKIVHINDIIISECGLVCLYNGHLNVHGLKLVSWLQYHQLCWHGQNAPTP